MSVTPATENVAISCSTRSAAATLRANPHATSTPTFSAAFAGRGGTRLPVSAASWQASGA